MTLRDQLWSSKAQPNGEASGSSLGTMAVMTCSEAINSYFQVQLTTLISGAVWDRPYSANGDLPGHRLEARPRFSVFNSVEFMLRNPFKCSTNVKATQVIPGDYNDFSANTQYLTCFMMARGDRFFGDFDF